MERVDEALRKVDEALDQKVEILKTTIVGKYWFRVVIGGLCAALLYIAAQNRFSNIEQTDTLKNLAIGKKEIIVVVNNIENKQIEVVQKIKAFESEIEQINKRQDVLRDAHMNMVQEKK